LSKVRTGTVKKSYGSATLPQSTWIPIHWACWIWIQEG